MNNLTEQQLIAKIAKWTVTMRVTTIKGEQFFAFQDVLMLLTGEPRTRRYRLYDQKNSTLAPFIDEKAIFRRFDLVNAAGVRQVCTKFKKESLADEILCGEVHDPFQHMTDTLKAHICEIYSRRGHTYEVSEMLKVGYRTDAEIIDLLRCKANDALSAFFRDKCAANLRDAMKALQDAVGAAECRGGRL